MFEIDRLHIAMKLENNNITEQKYFAIFGNMAVELGKELLIINKDEEKHENSSEVYRQHLIDARAVGMKNHLIELQQNMHSFIHTNTLIKRKDYATFTYEYDKYGYEEVDEKLVNNYIKTAIQFLDLENIKNSMSKLDTLAYFKAQKLYWEDKINDELSKLDKDEMDKESNEKEKDY